MRIRNLWNADADAYCSNCYFITDNRHGIIIDPGISASRIQDAIREEGCVLDGIYLTHGHFDHILSLDTLRSLTNAPVYIHAADASMLTDGTQNAYSLFFGEERTWQAADGLLQDGEIRTLGNTAFTVMHTPGHTPGSVCFWFPAARALVTGDTLFEVGCGRWDLPGGSLSELRTSIRKLKDFSRTETEQKPICIFPGHGDDSDLVYALFSLRLY